MSEYNVVDTNVLHYAAWINGIALATFVAKLRIYLWDYKFLQTVEEGVYLGYVVRTGDGLSQLYVTLDSVDPSRVWLCIHPMRAGNPQLEPLIKKLNPWLEHYWGTTLEYGLQPE